MKKPPGKKWFAFSIFGLPWVVHIIPANHPSMRKGDLAGFCCTEQRLIGLSDSLSIEQLRTTFVHELQHVIEDHADVNYERAVCAEVSDRCTDMVARGWLYFMREHPKIVAMLRDEPTP